MLVAVAVYLAHLREYVTERRTCRREGPAHPSEGGRTLTSDHTQGFAHCHALRGSNHPGCPYSASSPSTVLTVCSFPSCVVAGPSFLLRGVPLSGPVPSTCGWWVSGESLVEADVNVASVNILVHTLGRADLCVGYITQNRDARFSKGKLGHSLKIAFVIYLRS